jgi:hypothetical protein
LKISHLQLRPLRWVNAHRGSLRDNLRIPRR